jgi:hypothetical protein
VNPDSFQADTMRSKDIAPGIRIIIGKKPGSSSMETQAYRFDSGKFTADEAKAWLKDHKIEYISFEAATGKTQSKPELVKRFLNFNPGQKFETSQDGKLLIRDVMALAPGTWTDSLARTPCRYTPEVLQSHANNWRSNGFWSRHPGGAPRDVVQDKLGYILNQRFNAGAMVDIVLHGHSQKSRDTIEMVKHGDLDAVSVEMMVREHYDPKEKVSIADEIVFTGLAMVDEGACDICTIRGNEVVPVLEDEIPPITEIEQKEQEAILMEVKELEVKLAESDAKVKEMEAKQAATVKEMTDKIAASERALADANTKIKEMEKKPVPKGAIVLQDSDKELEGYVPTVVVTHTGDIYRGA